MQLNKYMKFNKQILYTFIIGICVGITALMVYIVFSGQIPFLKAAGLNSGAADINARYLDGYGTATASSSSKIYVSDVNGYLPDGSVDTGAILDGTINSGDISNGSVSVTADLNLSTDGTGSGLDADLLDGQHGPFFNGTCTWVTNYVSTTTASCTCTGGTPRLAYGGCETLTVWNQGDAIASYPSDEHTWVCKCGLNYTCRCKVCCFWGDLQRKM